jgi:hypothetical protein
MSRPKTYVVTLTDAQRAHVLAFLKKGAAKARMLTRARILLCSAEGKTDRLIADLLQVTPETVRNIRKRCATAGLEAALQERPRPGAQPNLDSTPEALRVALGLQRAAGGPGTLDDAPSGRPTGGTGGGGIHLRRTSAPRGEPNERKPWQKRQWRLRPRTTQVLWRMDDGRDRSAEPSDPQRPIVCMDERPFQLLADGRESLPMEPDQPQRVDDAYQRHGACNLLLFFQPRRGWRAVHATERRTNDDVARQMQWLVDAAFPAAEGSRVVLDNRNTHTPASL